MLTPSGGIKCDLTITRLGEQEFMVVTGGAMGLHDLAWIEFAPGPTTARWWRRTPLTAQCCIGLWGPLARDLLAQVCADGREQRRFPLHDRQADNSRRRPRSGLQDLVRGRAWDGRYTRPWNRAGRLWDILWEAGQPLGVIAAGGGAFESLRLEKGYRLWGNDIHTEYDPYEAGIGFAVRLKKGDFIGRDALVEKRAKGPTRKLCCMTLDDPNAVVMGKEPILDGDQVVSYVTSAGYGHSIGRGIVYGYLPMSHAAKGTSVDVLYFGNRIPATVAREPLYDPRARR